jgi:hypothetical protein
MKDIEEDLHKSKKFPYLWVGSIKFIKNVHTRQRSVIFMELL